MTLPCSLTIIAWCASKFWQKFSRYPKVGRLFFVRNLADLWRVSRHYLQHRRAVCCRAHKM